MRIQGLFGPSKTIHPKVAKRDMIIFKKLYYLTKEGKRWKSYEHLQRDRSKKQFHSLHFGFLYESGYEYTNDNFPPFTSKNTLGEQGLHSFGIGQYNSPIEYMSSNTVLVECVIPKGTRYYTSIESNDLNGPFVSESLIIGKPITRKRGKELEEMALKLKKKLRKEVRKKLV